MHESYRRIHDEPVQVACSVMALRAMEEARIPEEARKIWKSCRAEEQKKSRKENIIRAREKSSVKMDEKVNQLTQ